MTKYSKCFLFFIITFLLSSNVVLGIEADDPDNVRDFTDANIVVRAPRTKAVVRGIGKNPYIELVFEKINDDEPIDLLAINSGHLIKGIGKSYDKRFFLEYIFHSSESSYPICCLQNLFL